MELFVFAFGALFSIMNPLGTVPIFVGLVKENTALERAKIAFWTSFNVFIILLLSFFAGKYILSFFGISLDSLKIAGGLIITSSGFALLTGKFVEHKGMKKEGVKKDINTRSEIALTPLAIPILAGPGTISLLITYNQEYPKTLDIIAIIAAISIYIILRTSFIIVKVLGASGINALSRVIGFIVIAIGIEYITSAVINIVKTLEF